MDWLKHILDTCVDWLEDWIFPVNIVFTLFCFFIPFYPMAMFMLWLVVELLLLVPLTTSNLVRNNLVQVIQAWETWHATK